MSLFSDHLVVVRGGGDLGTGVAWRLRRSGFPVVVLELHRPLAVRRTVAFATAVATGSIVVEGIEGILVSDTTAAEEAVERNRVPVIVAERLPEFPTSPSVVVDARLAKRVLDTSIDQAPFVVALGPGFVAGRDCHAVIETMRGHRLGSVIWDGPAAPNTGVPGELGGVAGDRVLRADTDGEVTWSVDFGDSVVAGDVIGSTGDAPVTAPISGTIRGLIAPGPVSAGVKIGDIDPRGDTVASAEISDKALSVAGGVLEAVLGWLDRR